MAGMAHDPLNQLDRILLAIGREHEEVMLLEELDGFLAGVIVSPEMIPPSRWMPHVWSIAGDGKHEPIFEDIDHANKILRLIMDHYNSIARSLLPDSGPYEPVFAYDERSDDVIWELWAEGFERALKLDPVSWLAIPQSGDHEATTALAGLRSLIAINQQTSALPQAKQDRLTEEAPDLIAEWVETLSHWRLASNPIAPLSKAPAFKNVGRNDTCPCGSGKKYKKCHGAN
jgi:uncharacterized protein